LYVLLLKVGVSYTNSDSIVLFRANQT